MDYETDQELFNALAAPFAADDIQWRIGARTQDKSKGIALAYIDARTVMDRFDMVCGPSHWQNDYTAGPGMLICNIHVHFPGAGWTKKANGAGATDVEAEKGMASDAFKRAAVLFGVGRYLYDLKSPWVQLENEGRKIADGELKRLSEIHDEEARKIGWGDRPGLQAYRLLKKIVNEFVTDAGSAQEFRTKNKAEIALLPAAMRLHLFESLDRIGSTPQREAAE